MPMTILEQNLISVTCNFDLTIQRKRRVGCVVDRIRGWIGTKSSRNRIARDWESHKDRNHNQKSKHEQEIYCSISKKNQPCILSYHLDDCLSFHCSKIAPSLQCYLLWIDQLDLIACLSEQYLYQIAGMLGNLNFLM